MTVDDTGNSNDDSSLCLCSLFPLPRIAELVGSPSSEATFATIEPFQRLVDWIRGKNLPCAKKSGLCRLETARGILQAIRDSLPTVEEPTATAGMKHDTLTRQQSTNQQIQTDLRMNDVCSFPPLALASGTCTSTSTSNCSPQKQQVNAAFPVLGAPSPTKKGKRRIRPAMISTSPLTTIDKTTAESRKSVWGSETKIASWPGTRSSTNHNTSSNLLERRLSATNTHGNESASSTTSTKINPTVNLSPGPTPTKKILTYDTDSNECLRDGLQKPPPPSLVRLVDLYTAIVESLLVQSTPNEVQYVLRLSHRATSQNNLVLEAPQRPVFRLQGMNDDYNNEDRNQFRRRILCVQFAVLVFKKWSDRLIRWGFASNFTECPSIQQYCPDLYQQSKDYLTQNADQRNSHPRTTVFWTLPFNEMRDSRNRYRTPDELALYRNREETRDSFLSHLRSFYNQGSSVQITISKSADQVRKAARSVLGALLDDNMPWMAEFYTDMLLQLGSVPVQETDREVLKMADQEKVQKLHQRFKAPAPRKGNSNSGGRTKKSSPVLHETSPITAVQEEYFRGHQEFFFYFVMLADSHKLNHHLRHQFQTKIYRESSNLSSTNIDRSLEDLCVLAKFLGLLVFSPNWHSSKFSLDDSRSRSLVYDELDILKFGGKGVIQFLQEAWNVCRLVSVIPWLVEMLRMSLGDETFRRTHSFREVSRLLRLIQLKALTESHRVSRDCKEVLLMCLESFVDDIASLEWIETLKLDDSEIESSEGWHEKNGLDTDAESFDRRTIFSCNNRIEDVLNTVIDLTRSSRGLMRSPGASRKVRPSMVMTDDNEKKLKPHTPEPAIDSESKVQIELRASFFHLHRDLQVICEFVVDRVVNNLSELLKSVQVDESLVTLPDDSLDAAAMRKVLKMKCTDCLCLALNRCLEKSLALFAPNTDKDVRQIAITVSVEQGMQTGRPKLDAMVSERVSTATNNLKRLQQKKLFGKDERTNTSELSGVIMDLKIVQEEMRKHPEESNDLLACLEKARSSLDLWIKKESLDNPPEEDLRSFYFIISELDSSFSSFFEGLMSSSIVETHDWFLLIELLRIAALSSFLCNYGFQSAKVALSDTKTISWLVSGGESCRGDGSMKTLIHELCQARLIPIRLEAEAIRLAGGSDGQNES